ncbi:MAG: type II toxin-antitoxin system HipA family toxin [Pseudomonadota bacterium]
MDLFICFHGKPCGLLTIEDERMRFQYLTDYVTSNGPPLSVAMPIREEPWPDSSTFPFFENLLPEGVIRDLLATELGTANNNFAQLLEATGGDVAGAITIESPNTPPHTDVTPRQPALNDATLGDLVERIKKNPLLPNNTLGMRLSLAGAQNKLPVILDEDGALHLPGQHPSTHILKPPSDRFPALVENELLCMRAAKRAGLEVPNVRLVPFRNAAGAEHDCYVVTRYDRLTDASGKTQRLHQEDTCQIMCIPSARKYSQDGGPRFGDLFRILRQFSTPAAVHQQELIKRIFFNLVIGNQDAHGKNFSLLHTGRNVVLSPTYDLVCTLVYDTLSDRMAMPLGNAWHLGALDAAAMTAFQEETGVALRRQAGVLRRFIDHAESAVADEAQVLMKDTSLSSHATLERIVRIAQRNAELLKKWL